MLRKLCFVENVSVKVFKIIIKELKYSHLTFILYFNNTANSKNINNSISAE